LESEFNEERRAEGITLTENKVLVGLYPQRELTVEELTKMKYFGRVELEDALAELQKRGDITRISGAKWTLTQQGRDRRAAIMRRVAARDAKKLAGVSPEEMEATRSVLYKLQTTT